VIEGAEGKKARHCQPVNQRNDYQVGVPPGFQQQEYQTGQTGDDPRKMSVKSNVFGAVDFYGGPPNSMMPKYILFSQRI
jgi:hypothetical protein